jgi:riboflavin synthase
MFTGIIQAVGQLASRETRGGDVRLVLRVGGLDLSDVALGDSIAVNGVCLTVIAFDAQSFSADVSRETLAHTLLDQWPVGFPVNLEKALRLSDRLGGHLVSGHVDGVGEVLKRYNDGRSVRFDIRVPESLKKYVATKGSIALNGISLTANQVVDDCVGLNVVPHTLDVTSLGQTQAGDRVHIEVDLIARHLERFLQVEPPKTGVSQQMLRDRGYM